MNVQNLARSIARHKSGGIGVISRCSATVCCDISLNLAVLGRVMEPGVGASARAGNLRRELFDAMKSAQGGYRLLAMEIFEYNSYRETHFKAAQAVHDLCVSVARLR
ncbi:MAG TPA: hypothetical protein VEP67_08965 [Thiobacillaceae bacterium]|nr:hypothetical protein [Thiobacillaceae bacterium]